MKRMKKKKEEEFISSFVLFIYALFCCCLCALYASAMCMCVEFLLSFKDKHLSALEKKKQNK